MLATAAASSRSATSDRSSCCDLGAPSPPSSKSGDLLDITCTEDSFSICDEDAIVGRHNKKNSDDDTVASSVFSTFLLCGDDLQKEPKEFQHNGLALLDHDDFASPAAAVAGARTRLELHRPEQGTNGGSRRYMWRSTQQGIGAIEDDIFSFHQPHPAESMESQEKSHDGNSHHRTNSNSLALLPILPSEESSSSYGSLFDEEDDHTVGGTVDDPQYVPRPTSTTPSLREMASFYSSRDDDDPIPRTSPFEAELELELGEPAFPEPSNEMTLSISKDPEFPGMMPEDNPQRSSPSKYLETEHASSSKLPEKKSSSLRQRLLLNRRIRSDDNQIRSSASTFSFASASSSVVSSVLGARSVPPIFLPRSRTAETMATASTASSVGPSSAATTITAKKEGKNPVMKLLRRTRFSTFRKQQRDYDMEETRVPEDEDEEECPKATVVTPSSTSSRTEMWNATCSNEEDAASDVVDILASLDISLRKRAESELVLGKQHGISHGAGALLPMLAEKMKIKKTNSSDPALEESGETQSDASQDDVFSGVLSDETDTESRCSVASSQDSRCTVDRFLSSPYSRVERGDQPLQQWSSESVSQSGRATSPTSMLSTFSNEQQRSHVWPIQEARSNEPPNYHQSWSGESPPSSTSSIHHYYDHRYPYNHRSSDEGSSMLGSNTSSVGRLYHPADLMRCSSVDTTKASNLGGLGSDRARLLDLQAFVWQQQQQELARLNAPPIDFETPDGDGVIRVQETACEHIDAACEIEVLPKQEFLCGTNSNDNASTGSLHSASTDSFPSTAAEF
ncbi:expressed unknown protein [Seminavis robusta]|uniref:Uncharacterized protein n=1 Tax=Seminavis robusta TaxID=568900 RepID=A0A9N8H779_9STRA|nr:expressed unknown protein [Seminavis robusta]|eukprot:Sro169_g075200.1 n/a (795) ;mRNA; r:75252-77636